MNSSSGLRRTWLALWGLTALLWFAPLNSPHLFDPDEGRYAEIPREMVVSGDWVTPRLDAIKYFEKPPLQYWATAAAFKAFGEHPWSVRLWPAFCGFIGLVMTWWLGCRLYGRRAAAFATLIQAGALLYLALSRIATIDMSLCAALQLTLCGLVLLAQRPARSGRVAATLLAVGVPLAVLAKGLIGILIPGSVALLFVLLYRDWRLLWAARPWWALAALGLIAAPWFVLVSQRNPEFAHFFFVYQHFQRYLRVDGFDRYQPVWYFLPILVGGFLPWTTLLPRALRGGVSAALRAERGTGMLLLWAGFIFVFFSLSKSKLPPYILPLVPALSLLTGRALGEMTAVMIGRHLALIALFAALIGGGAFATAQVPAAAPAIERLHASIHSIEGFAGAFMLLAVAAVGGYVLCRGGRGLAGIAVTALGSLAMAQAALLSADGLPPKQGVVQLVRAVQPALGPATRVYCVNDYVQPLPFALRRPCTLVGYRGELDFGLRQEPWRWIPDLQHFAPIWQQQSDAIAVLRPEDYPALRALGAPMRLIYSAPSFTVVARE